MSFILLFFFFFFFFFFKQKTAYDIASCLVGSEMCISASKCHFQKPHLWRLYVEGLWPAGLRATGLAHPHTAATLFVCKQMASALIT